MLDLDPIYRSSSLQYLMLQLVAAVTRVDDNQQLM